VHNDTYLEDIEKLEQLDRDCIALHLCPPPKTFIQLDVENQAGEKVLSRKMRSQSWNRNAYNHLLQNMAGIRGNLLNGAGAGYTGQLTITAGVIGNTTVNSIAAAENVGAVSTVNKGIVVGASGIAEQFDGYVLQEQFYEGNALGSLTSIPIPVSYRPIASGTLAISTLMLSTNPANRNYFVIGIGEAPFVVAYKLSADKTLVKLGAMPTAGHAVVDGEWSPNGTYIACIANSVLRVYKNNGDDTFTLLNNPSSTGKTPNSVCWSPDSTYIGVAVNGSPYFAVYKNNGDDTFTLLVYPSAALAGSYRPAWSPDGDYVLLLSSTSPYICGYANNGNDTFTALGAITALSHQGPTFITWTNDSSFVLVTSGNTADTNVYQNDEDGTFTKLSNVSPAIGTGGRVDFNSDGSYAVVVGVSTPFIKIYKSNGDGTFTILSNHAAAGNSGGMSCQWLSGEYFILASAASPYLYLGKLQTTLNYTAQDASTASYDAGTKKLTVTLKRIFNNNSSVLATIKELAIYSNSSLGTIMMNRDILSSPVEVPAAYKLTATYTIEMTYPS